MAKENAKVATTAATNDASTYSRDELADNAPVLFGHSIDTARAALICAKVESATVEEARKIIKAFAERKV